MIRVSDHYLKGITMSKLAKLAGTLPFAHLLGVKAARAESSTDDEDDKKDKDNARAEDDESDTQASTVAEGDDPKDDEDEDKKDAKSSKAKKAKADDEPDGDEDDKESMAARSERARCAVIVAHGIKTGAVRQACAYAFDTSMSAEVAVATLNATAEDRRAGGSLADRMRTEARTPAGPDASVPEAGSVGSIVAAASAALKKARGEA